MNRTHIILLTLIFLICLAYVMLYVFWFSEQDEFFYKAFEIGQVLNKLSLSYIAAYIFYLVVNYIPLQKRKNNLLDNLSTQIDHIRDCVNQILKELNYSTDEDILTINDVTMENLKMVLEKTPPNFQTSINYTNQKNATILNVIDVNLKNIHSELVDLEKHYELYSTDLYRLLKERIRDKTVHSFPVGLKMLSEANAHKQKNNLAIFTGILFEYIKKTQDFIQEWNENKN